MVPESRLLEPTRSNLVFDLTPLIDAVFILLIFFVVATTFREEEKTLRLDLPTATQSSPPSESSRQVVISVDASGRCFYDDTLVEIEAVGQRLRQDRVTEVIIRGDSTMAYQQIVDVIDQCYRANVRAMGLATLQRRTRK